MTDPTLTLSQISTDSNLLILIAEFPRFSPSTLFDHFINPTLLVRWWPPVAVVEPRVGGKYQFSWPAMKWDLVGEYSTFEPGRQLGFTWFWMHEPHLPVRRVQLAFEPAGAGTRLRLVHGSYSDDAKDQADRQSHLEGWTHFLGRLNALG
jgi:uncharacterized protein YndB with AHSA1/START domain